MRKLSSKLEEAEQQLDVLREERRKLILTHASSEAEAQAMTQDIRMVRAVHDFTRLYESIRADEAALTGRKTANDRLGLAVQRAFEDLATLTTQIGELEKRREVILKEHLMLSEKTWQEIRRLVG
jgi:hypothetical protein